MSTEPMNPEKYCDLEDQVKKKSEELNKAIAYSIVMDMIVDKKDEKSMQAWGYLHDLAKEECTHLEMDGSSAFIKPYENIDYKICNYCHSN